MCVVCICGVFLKKDLTSSVLTVKCQCISLSDCPYLVFPSEPDKEDREKIDSDSSVTSTSDEEDGEPAAKYTVRKPLSEDRVPLKRSWYLFWLIDLTS